MKNAIKAVLKVFIPARFRPILAAMPKKLRHFGFRYKCTFCNSHLGTLLPFGFDFPVLKEKNVIGGGYRQNALCPICGSIDRERLLHLYLLQKTDIFQKPRKLLHIAPESRLKNIFESKANIDYLTADLSSPGVMVKMDITNIQFSDECFDTIICNHVLEHIVDDDKAMAELYRILKSGGWGILQVPLSLTLKSTYEDASISTIEGREQAFGQGDHVRIYAEDYQDRLRQAGFKVNVFKWGAEADNFGGKRNLFGLLKDEPVYFVSK